jgi:hypothetical protein
MKAYYFRQFDFENYLIPENDIARFDELVESWSDGDYDRVDEFNDKFQQYKCEGELFDTRLFIES